MVKYSAIRNYKKFKKMYPNFVLFIKYGKYYYIYEADTKILIYLYDSYTESNSFRMEKEKFKDVLSGLFSNGLNVV